MIALSPSLHTTPLPTDSIKFPSRAVPSLSSQTSGLGERGEGKREGPNLPQVD